jgi:hypothetical protein
MTYLGEYTGDREYAYIRGPLKCALEKLAKARDYDSALAEISEMPEDEYRALRRQVREDGAVSLDRIREMKGMREAPLRVGETQMSRFSRERQCLARADEANADDEAEDAGAHGGKAEADDEADEADDTGGKAEAEDEAPADRRTPQPVRGP